MSEKLRQFLVELSKDPMQMEDFWKDPGPFLIAADLTAEEKEVLRSGDSERIQKLLGPVKTHSFFYYEIQHRPHPPKPPRKK